jgi:signal transduction histidine kinase
MRILGRLLTGPRGLSARLLTLTIVFVMLSEVFVYVPSIARFREGYLQERIAVAHLATLALEATPDNMVSEQLQAELLRHARAHAIVIRRPGEVRRVLAETDLPMVDETCDLGSTMWFDLIADAFKVLASDGSRTLRVMGPSPQDANVEVAVVFDEGPMRAAMLQYSSRVLALSLVISLITAGFVFLALQWMMIRPLRRLSANITAFSGAPESADRVIETSARQDEIGVVQRELAAMESTVRAALVQKTRLATLGTAVAKINHDLRNVLASVQLLSDRIARSSDPAVTRLAPTLLKAVDRAVALCSRTLDYARDEAPAPERTDFALAELVDEVAGVVQLLAQERGRLVNTVPPEVAINADREQLFRVLVNLARNAAEAGAETITVGVAEAAANGPDLALEIADDGPGLPPRARDNLFQPFAGSARAGGTGLGLAIAREIARLHGGELTLVTSSADGTTFRLDLPGALTTPPASKPARRRA